MQFIAVIPVAYHGAEIAAGAQLALDSPEDFAEMEPMIQLGAIRRAPGMPAERPTVPMKTTDPPATPEQAAEDKPARRQPGTRPEGYGRRDLKPTE